MSDYSQATPRPWWAEDDGTLRHGNGISFVKLISPWIEQAWNGDAEAIANSHLIAAAVNAHDALLAGRDRLRQALDIATEALTDYLNANLDYGDDPVTVAGIHAHGVLARIREARGDD